jgi:hypothetical protein
MPKRYSTTYTDGVQTMTVEESNPTRARDFFRNAGVGVTQTFALKGKTVSREEFFADILAAEDAKWEKKEQTHRRIRYQDGVSGLNYLEKWVRK